MKRVAVLLFLTTALVPRLLNAQAVMQRHVLWLAGQGQARLSERWSAGLDMQARRDNWGRTWYQWLVRPSASYTFLKAFTVSAGGGVFANYPKTSAPQPVRYEWRPWEELSWKKEDLRIGFGLRFREEQRFQQEIKNATRTGRYDLVLRSRFRADLTVPVGGNGVYAALSEEYMLNHKNTALRFDQNRVYAGPGWKKDKTDVSAQYIWLYQQRSDGAFEAQHILRLTVKRTFDRRKKKPAPKQNHEY